MSNGNPIVLAHERGKSITVPCGGPTGVGLIVWSRTKVVKLALVLTADESKALASALLDASKRITK